jgi:23S rRNA (adenine2503-C2)-methyltransferase
VRLDAAIDVLAARGEPAYRAAQLRQAVTRDLVASWDEVTTLPRALRERLEAEVPFSELVLEETQEASDGTIKARFRTLDGFPLETVLMRYDNRRTVCVSSQSGCALGCTFCATGAMGIGRDLTRGEIFEQLLWAARVAQADEARVGNVVLMGMGEPMQNIEEVLGFCHLANDPEGFGLGARSIAISTAGWVPGIDRLAQEPMQVKLAISLHAPNDALRSQLMPVNRRYNLAQLMAACQRYREATRRRIFVEYLMLDGVNDSPALADELADLLHGTAPGGFHVNLIVYNPTDSAFRASPEPVIQRFLDRLEARRVPTSVRRSKGTDIAAACGQLAVEGAKERRAEVMRDRRAAASANAS